MRTDRGLLRAAWGVLLGGLLVLAWTGLHSVRYRPGWSEPRPSCFADGECTAADVAAGLQLLWWVVGAGGVLVLAGVALTVWRMPAGRPAGTGGRLPSAAQALVAGLLAYGLGWLLTVPVFVALFLGPHAWPAALAGTWLAQAGAVAGLHAGVGGPGVSARRAWLTGLAASAAGIAALVWAALGAGAPLGSPAVLLAVDAVPVALAVWVSRLLDEGPAVRRRPGVRLLAGAVVVALVVAVVQAGAAVMGRPPPPVAAPVDPVPLPTVEPPPPTPAPVTTTPPPAPLVADAPCAQEDLDLTVVGFDAALGARAASVHARNSGDAPCWVEGVPVVTLHQGGRPLALAVEPGRRRPAGRLPPSGSASPPAGRRPRCSPGGRTPAGPTR